MSIESARQEASALSPRRIALSLQYDGSGFCGWQRQKEGLSVQGVLEQAISELDPLRPVKVVAAGRTDAGVHAIEQVANIKLPTKLSTKEIQNALNGNLKK